MTAPWLLPILALLFAGWLWGIWRAQQRKLRAGRAGLLISAGDLLASPTMSTDAHGYACLKGDYEGYQLSLSFEPEHYSMRKLPNLCLHISVMRKRVGLTTLDILMRPQNTEAYSPYWGWDVMVQPLPAWPQHALYRSREQPPALVSIDTAIQSLFSDERCKELLLTERALRITYLAQQAERGDYLLLRAANFDHAPLPALLLQRLLQQAVKLTEKLETHTGLLAGEAA